MNRILHPVIHRKVG